MVISFKPSRVAQLVGHLTRKSGVLGSIPGLATYFRFSFRFFKKGGGGRVVRWSWINFQCRGVLLVWMIVGQGPIALAVGAGGGCLDIFSLLYLFFPLSLLSSFSLSLGDGPI